MIPLAQLGDLDALARVGVTLRAVSAPPPAATLDLRVTGGDVEARWRIGAQTVRRRSSLGGRLDLEVPVRSAGSTVVAFHPPAGREFGPGFPSEAQRRQGFSRGVDADTGRAIARLTLRPEDAGREIEARLALSRPFELPKDVEIAFTLALGEERFPVRYCQAALTLDGAPMAERAGVGPDSRIGIAVAPHRIYPYCGALAAVGGLETTAETFARDAEDGRLEVSLRAASILAPIVAVDLNDLPREHLPLWRTALEATAAAVRDGLQAGRFSVGVLFAGEGEPMAAPADAFDGRAFMTAVDGGAEALFAKLEGDEPLTPGPEIARSADARARALGPSSVRIDVAFRSIARCDLDVRRALGATHIDGERIRRVRVFVVPEYAEGDPRSGVSVCGDDDVPGAAWRLPTILAPLDDPEVLSKQARRDALAAAIRQAFEIVAEMASADAARAEALDRAGGVEKAGGAEAGGSEVGGAEVGGAETLRGADPTTPTFPQGGQR